MRRSGYATVIAVCTGALALAGCGSTSTSAEPAWSTGPQVIDGVTEAGFDCTFDDSGGGEQIATVEVAGGTLTNVACNGFDVILFESIDVMDELVGQACGGVTEEDKAAPDFAAPVIQSDTFFISGNEPAGAFPPAAQPDALMAAFGGEQITVSDLFDRVCG